MLHQKKITTSERTAAEATGVKHLCVLFCGSFFSVFCLLCFCARLFICALWSTAGKGLNSWLSFVVSNCEFVTYWYPGSGVVLICIDSWSSHPYLFWFISKLRVRMAPWNWFKPLSKIFYWPFQGGVSFVDHFTSVYCCCVVTCWGKGWPLDSCCDVYLCFFHFPMW